MTKVEAMREHIELREQFFQVKFNRLQRAYAMTYMMFHKQALIESANRGLKHNIDVIGNISPRPILLLHAAGDSVTSSKGSLEMFSRSKPPTELHLMTDVDHFMFGEDDDRVDSLVGGWLKKYFPVN